MITARQMYCFFRADLERRDLRHMRDLLKKHFADGKQLAAICAAPSVFGHLGFLEGKQATCFPGFEGELRGAQFVPERVVCDGNIVTSRGMGTAIDLGLCLVGRLVSDKISGMLAHSIQYK